MTLHSKILGTNKKTILILHGLYGSSDSWYNIGKFLSGEYCVHLPDLRNHGNSFHDNKHDYLYITEDIKCYTDRYGINNFNIIGHSMGGKAAMFFAVKYPEMIDKMVIADVSPRSYKSLTVIDTNIIFHLNVMSIMKMLELDKYSTYKEIGNHLNNHDQNIKNLILKNIKRESGKFVWKLNLDSLAENLGNIMDGLEIDDFIDSKIKTTTMFLKAENSGYIGEVDKKFIDFIFSDASIVEIPDSGHWLHIEQPGIIKNEILKFLNL